MLIIPYTLTILYALLCKPRRHFWIWCYFLICIMMLTAHDYADLVNYSSYYDAIVNGRWISGFEGISVSWSYLCRFFGLLHLSYRGMQVVILYLCFFAIHCVVKSIDLKENKFWGLYLIFPLPIQCVQTRFFLGTVIVWVGFGCLLRNDKRCVLKFLLSTILASFIHSSCILYSVLILVVLLKNSGLRKSALISVLIMGALYYFIGLVPGIVSRFMVDSAFNRYFVNSITQSSLMGFIRIVSIWSLSIILAFFHDALAKGNYYPSKAEKIEVIRSVISNSVGLKGLIFLGITLPLMVYDNNFCRYVMCGIVLSHFSFASCKRIKNRNNRFLVLLGYCVVLLFAVYVYIPIDAVLKPFFSIDGFYSIFR